MKENKERSQVGWIPKISIACISCMSCQQTRPISSSRQHRISTKLGMQHHIYPLSSLIISFYILTKLLLCYVFKRSRNTHITFIFGHFTVYAYRTLDIFLQNNPWIFISRQETISGVKLLDLLSIPGWLQLSRMWMCSK